MKKKTLLFVVLTILYTFGLVACSNNADDANKNVDFSANELQEVNAACIDVKTHDVVMQTDTEGVVTITVQLPDYESLYQKAYASKNPNQYLLKALESGKYDVLEYEITAKVTIEAGKEVIHADEAIKNLLEQELSNATNALMEVE